MLFVSCPEYQDLARVIFQNTSSTQRRRNVGSSYMEDVPGTAIDSSKSHPCCSPSSGLQPPSLSQYFKILTCWLFFFGEILLSQVYFQLLVMKIIQIRQNLINIRLQYTL